jgi:hypothetical protein
MAKLLLAVTVAAMVISSLSRIDRLEQADKKIGASIQRLKNPIGVLQLNVSAVPPPA